MAWSAACCQQQCAVGGRQLTGLTLSCLRARLHPFGHNRAYCRAAAACSSAGSRGSVSGMAAIMVLTAGSTGDVEPFVALAELLGKRGHTVTLTADAGFERLAPGVPVEFRPIRADFQSLLPTPDRKRPSIRGQVFPVIRGMLEDSWTVARSTQPDVIVAHQKSLAAPHLAEKLGVSHIQALTVPMLTPTREFPLPGVVRHDLGATLNRASYRLVGMLTRPYAGLIRDWRSASLGLTPRGNPPAPAKTLYCYSPSLVPTPKDWPPDTLATGFWLREGRSDAGPLNPDLESFLAAGEAPIYIGFGSSVGPDPAHLGAVVSNAVQVAGVRAVIASGWGGLRGVQSNSNTMAIESAPHGSLFPRVAAVVHHGGAGTTAAGLLAARPTVVCPFQGDQYFWGSAVHRAGAGPQPMPVKKLTPDRLALAIRAVRNDTGMQARAALLSERIAQENGAGRACEQIESALV
jgi:sterol 3beta-glucosyltransferase